PSKPWSQKSSKQLAKPILTKCRVSSRRRSLTRTRITSIGSVLRLATLSGHVLDPALCVAVACVFKLSIHHQGARKRAPPLAARTGMRLAPVPSGVGGGRQQRRDEDSRHKAHAD